PWSDLDDPQAAAADVEYRTAITVALTGQPSTEEHDARVRRLADDLKAAYGKIYLAFIQSDPTYRKLVRLRADLAAARTALVQFNDRSKAALAGARKALADGTDPEPHEDAFREADAARAIHANRIAALEALVKAAEAQSRRLL